MTSSLWLTLMGIGAVFALVLYVYHMGKAAQKAHEDAVAMAKAYENMTEREKTNEEIEDTPVAVRRDRLRVWVRDDK